MMHPVDLETLVGRQLRRLPVPQAPSTLLPRVLAAVQAWSRRPWYSRAWMTWPIAWQGISVAVLGVVVAGVLLVFPLAQGWVSASLSQVTSFVTADLPQIVYRLDVAASVMRAVWHTIVQPFLPLAFVLVSLMCAACAMCLVALNRALFGRILHS